MTLNLFLFCFHHQKKASVLNKAWVNSQYASTLMAHWCNLWFHTQMQTAGFPEINYFMQHFKAAAFTASCCLQPLTATDRKWLAVTHRSRWTWPSIIFSSCSFCNQTFGFQGRNIKKKVHNPHKVPEAKSFNTYLTINHLLIKSRSIPSNIMEPFRLSITARSP